MEKKITIRRLFKAALMGVLGLFTLITLISFLMPSEVHGRRGIVIQSGTEPIRAQLTGLYNWKNWHPQCKAYPDLLRFSNAGFATEGSTCTVNLPGRKPVVYTITKDDSLFVWFTETISGENPVEHTVTFSADSTTGGTYVDWKFVSQVKWYPWEKFAGIFTETITAPGYEAALNNLKTYVEGKK
jgi:hypothetical protein